MTRLDELARAARSDLTHAADAHSASRPELDVLRRRDTRRHTTSVVAVILLVAVGATGLIRSIAVGGEVSVPFIGEIEPAPTDGDEASDDEASQPDAERAGPVTLEFDSGGPEPHRLTITVDADGDVCLRPTGGTGTVSVWGGPICRDPLPAGSFSGGRAGWSSSTGDQVLTCELGAVREDVAAVELHFPEGSVEAADVVPAPEIGEAYYATCWEGASGLSTLVMFDEDGRELARRDFIER